MVTRLPTLETHLRTGARNASVPLSRLAAVLVAAIAGLLASVAAVPAAFANPVPVGDGGAVPATPVPAAVRVPGPGGMAGWQIILIALGAALLAAAATLLLDRAWAAHRAASATRA
jgi:hypothetical protein